jgi:preprotein translocase subunit SecG
MRYLIAIMVAFGLIGLGAIFVRSTLLALHHKLRSELQAAAARGEVSQAQADAGDLSAFGIELPETEMFQISIANALTRFRFVWISLVIVLCLGVAAGTRPREVPPKAHSSSSP